MKRIEEMTKEEILSLTQGQVDRMVDYRCAEEGISLLPPKPEKPEDYDIKDKLDVTVWNVGNMYFLNENEAKAVRELLDACHMVNVGYISGPRYEMKVCGEESTPNINSKKVFSEKGWEKVKEEVKTSDILMKDYEGKKKEYDTIYESRSVIAEEILGVINDVRREQRNLERYVAEFERYLELAEGDKRIAINFFEKAYPGILGEYPIAANCDVSEHEGDLL